MHRLHTRGDNVVPANLPALEAFLRRQALRLEAPRRARELAYRRELARTPLQASFLPPGNNIHRAQNLYLPDLVLDPFAAQVVFLAHLDVNGTDVFGRLGPLGGDAVINGVNPKFGAGCLRTFGGGAATYDGAVPFPIVFSGAWTLECWISPAALGGEYWGSVGVTTSGFIPEWNANGGGNTWRMTWRGGAFDTGVVIANGAYSALAMCVNAGNAPVRAFVNGVLVASSGNVADTVNETTALFQLNNRTGVSLNGFSDEWRFTRANRYGTTNYTPTGPFPNP